MASVKKVVKKRTPEQAAADKAKLEAHEAELIAASWQVYTDDLLGFIQDGSLDDQLDNIWNGLVVRYEALGISTTEEETTYEYYEDDEGEDDTNTGNVIPPTFKSYARTGRKVTPRKTSYGAYLYPATEDVTGQSIYDWKDLAGKTVAFKNMTGKNAWLSGLRVYVIEARQTRLLVGWVDDPTVFRSIKICYSPEFTTAPAGLDVRITSKPQPRRRYY